MISFDLPIRTVSLNGREHWAAKARRVQMERGTARLLTPATLKDSLPLMVRLVRIAPRPLDSHDNLAGSLKAVVDGIADKLGIKDNSPPVHWYYGQQRGKPREYAVRVEAVPKAVTV